jgi:hypothetical protein
MSRELRVPEREAVAVIYELDSLQLVSEAGKTLDSAGTCRAVVERN